ncbi:VWA domain-containing protein [Chryseolinea sp. T2]|uniref:VWA domain-containing protein n=1 Tax=Chryseolinea sp. T2 TaxID=3129255 RepID=UPI003077C35C
MIKELENIVMSFNWEEFHFLRPRALYLSIPLLVIVVLLLIGNKTDKRWTKMIAPHLRPFMFSKGNPWSIALPLLSFALATVLGIIAIAGPTWSQKKVPGRRVHAVTLITLDLSVSMLAKDIQPSRLERAKLKIEDFLKANPGSRIGLLAYAGTPHLVLPFTSDYKIIRHHAASLHNRAMPVPGTNYDLLVEKIDTVMKRIDAPSTVLLLTDVLDQSMATTLANWVSRVPHHLEIVLFSSPQGTTVPGHSSVQSAQDNSVIQNLTQNEKITVTPLTLDPSDVQSVADRIRKSLIFQTEDEKKEDVWDDRGWILIIPILALTLIWFRKGWVIQWCWLLLPVCLGSCGLDSKHPDWWYSKDYQGQLLSNATQYDSAAERFESDKYKAVAYFKAGNFEAAADLFALDTTATGNYNRGLALVKLGRYDEAMHAFDTAGMIDPSLKSKVDESRSKAQVLQHKSDSVLQYDPASASQKTKDLNEKKRKNDPLKERKPGSEDEKLSSDTQVKKLPKFGNRVTDETMSNIHSAKEQKEPPKDFKLEKQGGETNVIIRRSENDPGEFLHRRFELQKKRDYPQVKPSADPW